MHLRFMLRAPDGETVTRDVRRGQWAEPAGDADRVLGDGQWAIPGLVDAHAHLSRPVLDYGPGDPQGAARRSTEALEAGVTLLLDKGWRDLTVVDLIDRVEPGLRPDIEAAGRILAVEGGYIEGFCRSVEPGSLAALVREAAGEGRGWVKLIGDWPRRGIGPLPNFTEDEMATAVRIAAEAGSRVAVHTLARDVPSMAVRAGVHSVEHGLFLSRADLAALGARGGMWVPTVVMVDALIEQLGADSTGGSLLREGLANVAANVASAVESGVHVLTGTDLAVGSHQVAIEAMRLAEMGLTAAMALDAVAHSGLAATGRSVGFEIDSPANAVLLPESPLENLGVLLHPSHVIRHGRMVR
jgi:imidazolonepropionase-like amidohydrolase